MHKLLVGVILLLVVSCSAQAAPSPVHWEVTIQYTEEQPDGSWGYHIARAEYINVDFETGELDITENGGVINFDLEIIESWQVERSD